MESEESGDEEKPFSHLLDLTSDPSKINDVFPLVQPKVPTTHQRTPSPRSNSHSTTPNPPSTINTEIPIDDEDDLQDQIRRNTIANHAKQQNKHRFSEQAYSRRDTMPSKHAPGSPKLREPTAISLDQTGSNEPPTTSSTLSLKQSQQAAGSFLAVDQQQFLERAQSADMLFLKPNLDDDDLRRASFDTTHSTSVMQTNGSGLYLTAGPGRRRGTGRKLPSTEMLEQQSVQFQHRPNQFDVPQIVAPQNSTTNGQTRPVSPRRGSFLLSRTPAIDSEHTPRQTSNPLPRPQIYESGHEFSRSWNAPEVYGPNSGPTTSSNRYGRRVVDTQLDYVRNERQPLTSAYSQTVNNYNSTNFTDFYRPQQLVRYAIIPNMPLTQPAHVQLVSTPRSNMLSLPLFQRQTKSVDEWNNGAGNAVIGQTVPTISHNFRQPSPLLERRTVSESAERHLMRQKHTVQHFLQPSNELSRQCQDLWHKREDLTSGTSVSSHHHGQFASADFSDTATSFESNDTGNGIEINEDRRAVPSPAQTAFAAKPSFKLRRPTDADVRRQKYRSLLIQRQIAASTLATSMAPMSPSSKNLSRTIAQNPQLSSSVEDDGATSESAQSSSNIFASSIESSEQSAATNATTDRPHISVSPRGVARTTSVALRQMTTARQARLHHNGARSYEMSNRDFSVDPHSDSIFRDFVRVDPRFESLRISNNERINQQQFVGRERAPTLPSRLRSPSQKPPNFNFSNSFASSGLRTSHYERQRTAPFYQPAMQTHHQSLIRR